MLNHILESFVTVSNTSCKNCVEYVLQISTKSLQAWALEEGSQPLDFENFNKKRLLS